MIAMSSQASEQNAGYPVKLTTRQWQVIDAVVDNEVNTRAEEGDADFVNTGRGVREAGWDQVAHWTPGTPGSGTWPPVEQIVTVTLTSDQWSLVVLSLDIWAEISQDTDNHENALAPRAIRLLVSAQVDDQLP
jgi:hypothetical protein